jgi:hypothetical protein
MGHTSLWWYPGGAATLREVDFGEGLSDLVDDQVRAGAVAEGAVGRITRVSYGEHFRVRVVLANFDDHALYRELRSLESHLKAGYAVMLAEDRDHAWGAWVSGRRALTPGTLAVATRAGNEWRGLTGGAATLGAGDIVWVQSAAPTSWRELSEVQSVAGNTVTLDAVRYHHSDTPVLLRHRDFWPALRLDSAMDEPIVTSNLRNTFTLDLRLREDVDALQSLHDRSATALSTAANFGRLAPGETLDKLLDDGMWHGSGQLVGQLKGVS